MSKLAIVQEKIKEGRGLNDSAARYLAWYLESLTQENDIRALVCEKHPSNNRVEVNHAYKIADARKQVDLNQIDRQEYDRLIAMYKKNFA